MRGRSIRLSILIVFILGLSVASLAFRDISFDLPGLPAFNRGGTGPLGLRLGLDLRGGAHLVYQADTDTRTEVTFTEPVDQADIESLLSELGFEGYEVRPGGQTSFQIKTPFLNEARQQELHDALGERLGAIASIQFSEPVSVTPDKMEGVLNTINRRVNLFGTDEPIVQRFGEDRIIVQLPGASGSVTSVEFSEPAATADLELLLQEKGYENFTVKRRNDRSYQVRTVSLSQEQRQELRDALASEIGSLASFQVIGGIEAAKSLIGSTAQLEFKERTCGSLGPGGLCLNPTD
ncbi:MAG TPA: hypothetical protein VFR55_11725, partial [Dehalococcoidia bacterium]|nr:hypothetical protein [Dehalococcoidia bacterium]